MHGRTEFKKRQRKCVVYLRGSRAQLDELAERQINGRTFVSFSVPKSACFAYSQAALRIAICRSRLIAIVLVR